jgi:hypothetical protein
MMVSFAMVLALAARPGSSRPGSGDVTVRVLQGRIDVSAKNAVLADILDRVARQTGMVVTYEGPPPRQVVSLTVRTRPVAEALAQILEGQGLNYALVMDTTATRVAKLLVTTAPPPRDRVVPVAAAPTPPPRHVIAEPAAPEPTDIPGGESTEAVPETPVEAGPPGVPPPPGAEGPRSQTPEAAHAAKPPPGMVPFMPPTSYSNSPFDPKPVTFGNPTPTPTPPPPQP